ncbi:MAG TPA: hypothetical protein VHR47_04030, partial [Bacillota bacterium]|nr:hypothetical protein [Bacillota bacterium]
PLESPLLVYFHPRCPSNIEVTDYSENSSEFRVPSGGKGNDLTSPPPSLAGKEVSELSFASTINDKGLGYSPRVGESEREVCDRAFSSSNRPALANGPPG